MLANQPGVWSSRSKLQRNIHKLGKSDEAAMFAVASRCVVQDSAAALHASYERCSAIVSQVQKDASACWNLCINSGYLSSAMSIDVAGPIGEAAGKLRSYSQLSNPAC